eukprot:Skav217709  [mRNA]  locus=scaffold2294:172224:172989:- [translate_table: standard]
MNCGFSKEEVEDMRELYRISDETWHGRWQGQVGDTRDHHGSPTVRLQWWVVASQRAEAQEDDSGEICALELASIFRSLGSLVMPWVAALVGSGWFVWAHLLTCYRATMEDLSGALVVPRVQISSAAWWKMEGP